jgi:hypothetical protein
MRFLHLILIFVILSPSCKKSNENNIETQKKDDDIYTVLAISGLNLRSKPTIKSKPITLLPFGTIIKVIDKKGPKDNINDFYGNWNKILFKNQIGWVFNQFIRSGDYTGKINIVNTCKNNFDKYKNLRITNPDTISSLPLQNKTLKYNHCIGYCESEPSYFISEIIFKEDKIIYRGNDIFVHTSIESKSIGIYKIENNILYLNIDQGITKEYKEDHFVKQYKSKKLKIKLFWNEKINGFLDEKTYNKLKNKDLYHLKKKNILLTKEDYVLREMCFNYYNIGDFIEYGYYYFK